MLFKYIHVSAVTLTLIFFIIRGLWMITDAQILKQKWVKILAITIDSILLASAIILTMKISQYPFSHSWLTAKVLALVIYIALGMIALHYGATKKIRIAAWFAALLCFGYIVSVALTRNPMSFY
ncbi:MAG: SirB2 family protein [Gammaproteobacteria bacterium]|nr:SirB2 family protein [Gammaproteobacteria bacterium]